MGSFALLLCLFSLFSAYGLQEQVVFDASSPFEKCCLFNNSLSLRYTAIFLNGEPLFRFNNHGKNLEYPSNGSLWKSIVRENNLCVSKDLSHYNKNFTLKCEQNFEHDWKSSEFTTFDIFVSPYLLPKVVDIQFNPVVGEESLATCLYQGFPYTNALLMKDNLVKNTSSDPTSVTLKVAIHNEDQVVLTCKVSIIHNGETLDATLNKTFSVNERPSITSKSKLVSVSLNESTKFDVLVNGAPKPDFNCSNTMTTVSEPIKVDERSFKYFIETQVSSLNDTVKCIATNYLGNDEIVFKFTLAPEKPVLIDVENTTKPNYKLLYFASKSGLPITNVTVKVYRTGSRNTRDLSNDTGTYVIKQSSNNNTYYVQPILEKQETLVALKLMNLKPATTYNLDFEVCNQADCTKDSIPKAFRTPPNGSLVNLSILDNPVVIPAAIIQYYSTGTTKIINLFAISFCIMLQFLVRF